VVDATHNITTIRLNSFSVPSGLEPLEAGGEEGEAKAFPKQRLAGRSRGASPEGADDEVDQMVIML
jgi:hypothetical protein